MVCVTPFRGQFGGVCTWVGSTYMWEWAPRVCAWHHCQLGIIHTVVAWSAQVEGLLMTSKCYARSPFNVSQLTKRSQLTAFLTFVSVYKTLNCMRVLLGSPRVLVASDQLLPTCVALTVCAGRRVVTTNWHWPLTDMNFNFMTVFVWKHVLLDVDVDLCGQISPVSWCVKEIALSPSKNRRWVVGPL